MTAVDGARAKIASSMSVSKVRMVSERCTRGVGLTACWSCTSKLCVWSGAVTYEQDNANRAQLLHSGLVSSHFFLRLLQVQHPCLLLVLGIIAADRTTKIAHALTNAWARAQRLRDDVTVRRDHAIADKQKPPPDLVFSMFGQFLTPTCVVFIEWHLDTKLSRVQDSHLAVLCTLESEFPRQRVQFRLQFRPRLV